MTLPRPHDATATVHMPRRVSACRWQFNGQPEGEEPRRLMGRDAAWATRLEGEICRRLQGACVLPCSDGTLKVVNDCYALRSLPCIDEGGAGGGTVEGARAVALAGRQPAHSDAPEPAEGRLCDLADDDMPLSAMLAVMDGTVLWVFPRGCGSADGDGGDGGDGGELLSLRVGELLVWRGDLVHAGAGYAHEHFRVHAYVDPPRHIYYRPPGKTNRCLPAA